MDKKQIRNIAKGFFPEYKYICELVGGVDYLLTVKDRDSNVINLSRLDTMIKRFNDTSTLYYLDIVNNSNTIDVYELHYYCTKIKGKFILVTYDTDEIREIFKEYNIHNFNGLLVITNYKEKFVSCNINVIPKLSILEYVIAC